MAVTIFEDLVLRERGDSLLEVAVPQRQQRALVVEERHARRQSRHLRLQKFVCSGKIQAKFIDGHIYSTKIQLGMLAERIIQLRWMGDAEFYTHGRTHLKRRDAALQLGDVLQLAHARPLRGLPVRQDPASFAAREAPQLVNSASQRSRIAGIER